MPESHRRELTALRLTAQRIGASDLTRPDEVVRWMLAMQAQDLPGARWSVGLRLPGSTEAEIERALDTGEIVRSWPMRGTLHLVAPEDLGWMLAISGPRQSNWAAKRRGDLAITDAELARAGDLATELMTGGRAIRRDRLLEAWDAAGIPTTGQRGYHLLWNLGHAWWASITLGDARKGLAIAAPALDRREFAGVDHYFVPGLEPAAAAVHALPGFDEYMLGYRDRSPALAAEFSDRVVPGNNGVFQPTIVVDGEIIGTWKRTETGSRARVATAPFRPLTKRAEAGFDRAMRRYAEFTGKTVTR